MCELFGEPLGNVVSMIVPLENSLVFLKTKQGVTKLTGVT